ncbi:hypothetical protein H2C83_06970 [Thermoactinomyces sp. AMNI-1]|uniref:CRISPR system Cms protein Csm4 n=2 Tax=Thermoactinomyces mirandus TaxID=2756294 RepID=A0A7W2AR81_9BACL|nr:hypothetical protein [Thermoactinomyces mirandus]
MIKMSDAGYNVCYRLRLSSGFITPFQSDTLMGSLAWQMLYHFGESKLRTWIEACRHQPPFVLSNAFPLDKLPKLMAPPASNQPQPTSKLEQLQVVRRGKKYKERVWLTPTEFNDMKHGRPVQWEEKESPKFVHTHSRLHAIIDRATGQSLQENGLYEIEESYVEYVSLYVRYFDPTYEPIVEQLLGSLGKTGFGAKKSSGKGLFSVEKDPDAVKVLATPEGANGYAILSQVVPAATDETEGYYKFVTKYGKIGEHHTESPFKYPHVTLQPGSCFYSDRMPAYSGRLVEGIAPRHPNVVQFGFGLTVPIVLPEKEE